MKLELKFKCYSKSASDDGVNISLSEDFKLMSEFWRYVESLNGATVCQWIGIKDTKGEDVYEGDTFDGGDTGWVWVLRDSYFGDPSKYHLSNELNSGREIKNDGYPDEYYFSSGGDDRILLEVIGNINDKATPQPLLKYSF